MKVYAYVRVSTKKQDTQSQMLEISEWANRKNIKVDKFICETVSGTKDKNKRKLGTLLKRLKEGDVVIATEISRFTRTMFDLMEILKICMEKEVKVYTIKGNYELGDNIQSKVLAFAFGIAAEMERELISQRTKEGLRFAQSKGVKLGRPVGESKTLKLRRHRKSIMEKREEGWTLEKIAEYHSVHVNTVRLFLKRQSKSKRKPIQKPIQKKVRRLGIFDGDLL